MNKKGKFEGVFIVIAVAFLIAYFMFFSGTGAKTILEHKVPADISQSEKGTGLDLNFYDENGNKITIPEWFKVQSSIVSDSFTIVKHPPAPTCTDVTQCIGYATNPNIGCWKGSCVLQNVNAMDLGVNVQNPVGSQITFLNVAPNSGSPTAFWTNLDKTVKTLAPGETKGWQTTSPLSVAGWEGTQQVFNVVVKGTNEYDGSIVTASDSITLSFETNPTGSFFVSIVSPI